MVKMIALRELTGDYGHVQRGDVFECSEECARDLETRSNGPLAVRYWSKKKEDPPENKMLVSEENKSEENKSEENKVERILPKKRVTKRKTKPRAGKRRK